MADRSIYLDYASATPVDPEVFLAMKPYFREQFFNPSSLYAAGREVRKDLDVARSLVAQSIGAHDDEIIFTSGGTEADNLALMGVVQASQREHKHIIVSAIEHPALLNTAKELALRGVQVDFVPVSDLGEVDLKALEQLISANTVLVSVMFANNEVGTLQPMREIAKLCNRQHVLFHTDASQALGLELIDVNDIHVDLLTLNSGKIYGPKGAGALYVRRGITLQAQLFGGAQERGFRPGTENVPAYIGFAKACNLAVQHLKTEKPRLLALRDRLIRGLLAMPGVSLNGHPTARLANNVHVTFSGIEGDALLLFLDEAGIMASAGSACKATSVLPSHVLLAMGKTEQGAKSSLRFSLGRFTQEQDIDYLLEVLPGMVAKLKM